jgi:uncharacterized membrane protein
MAETQFERKFLILKGEWDLYQTAIGRYDTIVFGIRGWAVTVFAAVLSASVSLKSPSLVLFTIAPTLLFWIVDALNKSFQEVFIERARNIEAYLQSKQFEADIEGDKSLGFATPQISQNFLNHSKSGTLQRITTWRCFWKANVVLVYGSICIMCIACWTFLTAIGNH